MTLCDASPLIALINTKDPSHNRCLEALSMVSGPLVTTWPCWTEAMYTVHQYGGWKAQAELWSYLEEGLVNIRPQYENESRRMSILMETYCDTPMDLADASLVAAAEAMHMLQIFTLDSDFYIYRLFGNQAFEVIPK